mgnify:CR=1 FL=1
MASPETWWPELDPETQHWLQHHIGDALTEEILDAVVAAGGEPQGEFVPGAQEAPDRYDLTREDWDWIAAHLDDVVEKLHQHLTLLVLPMIAGFAIAFALAILALRRPGTVGPVTVVTGLLYTIPSLAAFAVLRPIFGLSLWTAVIPLAIGLRAVLPAEVK